MDKRTEQNFLNKQPVSETTIRYVCKEVRSKKLEAKFEKFMEELRDALIFIRAKERRKKILDKRK